MNNQDFWTAIVSIVKEGFAPKGLAALDSYAEQFIDGMLVYKRFSPVEQHGCAAGGAAHVVASLLAGAEAAANHAVAAEPDFKRELQQGARQASVIEQWAQKVGLWIDDVENR